MHTWDAPRTRRLERRPGLRHARPSRSGRRPHRHTLPLGALRAPEGPPEAALGTSSWILCRLGHSGDQRDRARARAELSVPPASLWTTPPVLGTTWGHW